MTGFIFWVSLFLILYAYAGYSVLILLVSVFFRERVVKREFQPRVSVLIAAYNEEKSIAEKLNNTLALDYPKDKMEIVVVSDGSTDRTDEIVKSYAGAGVKLFRVEGRGGKTEARNRAVPAATGEIIVFSDATTVYDAQAVKMMVRNFADPAVGAVSGRYDYVGSRGSSVSAANILFWRYENFIKSRQSAIKTLTGMSGCINAFRKELYEPLPPHIIEDLVEPLKILEKGYRIVFEPEALAYELTTDTATQEFRMRVRVISQGMTGLLYMKNLFNPFRYFFVSFQLLSHKVLRWFVPFFLIALFASGLILSRPGNFYFYMTVLQSLFYLAAAGGLLLQRFNRRSKALSFPLYFCTLNSAAVVALVYIVRGNIIHRWETVR